MDQIRKGHTQHTSCRVDSLPYLPLDCLPLLARCSASSAAASVESRDPTQRREQSCCDGCVDDGVWGWVLFSQRLGCTDDDAGGRFIYYIMASERPRPPRAHRRPSQEDKAQPDDPPVLCPASAFHQRSHPYPLLTKGVDRDRSTEGPPRWWFECARGADDRSINKKRPRRPRSSMNPSNRGRPRQATIASQGCHGSRTLALHQCVIG